MAYQESFPNSGVPELHLLPKERFDLGLWESLKQNYRDTFHPEKLPPLQLTSRPVRVRDIWGDYNYRKRGAWFSGFLHACAIAGLIAVSVMGAKVVKQVNQQSVSLI